MTTLNDAKRAAVVVGGISAVVCASAAYYWVKSKNGKEDNKKINRHRKNSHKLSTTSSNCQNNNSTTEFDISDDQEESENNFSSSESSSVVEICGTNKSKSIMLPVVRGGRKNYRALKKSSADCAVGVNQTKSSATSSAMSMAMANNRPHHLQTDAEVNATRLAAEFSSKINLSTSSSMTNGQIMTTSSSPDGDLVATMMMNDNDSQSPSPKGQCAESPSLASDGRSEVKKNLHISLLI